MEEVRFQIVLWRQSSLKRYRKAKWLCFIIVVTLYDVTILFTMRRVQHFVWNDCLNLVAVNSPVGCKLQAWEDLYIPTKQQQKSSYFLFKMKNYSQS